ncbi:MAG: electron transfer flavoprotein subunit beta/FixA family protein, partial [Candidatus Atribacteria bacterium]|nr:electron transfer flavoprotein subunit beta/FixA family protein [Candidatus Atribacteria bacterium]
MKIVACIKQVPEISEVMIDPKTHTLKREGVPSIVNPFDENAVEEGLRIKEKYSGELIVITMGPPQAEEALRKCLAMGADEAILISDKDFAGSDTLATAYTLSLVIKQLKADLIICGKQAIDGDTAQVGPELAEQLGIPQITYVKKAEIPEDKKRIILHKETDDGYEIIQCKLPVLITVLKILNEPRYPSIRGILTAKKKEVKIMKANDLNANYTMLGADGSPTQVVNIFTP